MVNLLNFEYEWTIIVWIVNLGKVEQQIQEIEKLNVVINTLEKDMLDLKSRFEKAVEERNVTGKEISLV